MATIGIIPRPAPVIERLITVRRIADFDEYRECERLQERVWGSGDIAGVPLLDLLTAQENGGMVLGAFDGDTLAGFVYSFPGIHEDGRIKQASVLLAVAGEYRGRGLGATLKLAQREEAMRQGIDLITWTYDPLRLVNAGLNIHRLGGIAREYRVNHYDSGSGLNQGLDTDRLIVEWWLDGVSRSGFGEFDDEPVALAEVVPAGNSGFMRMSAPELDADAPELWLPVPPDITAIKNYDLGLARDWQLQTRMLFRAYFERGYAVVDFGVDGRGPGYLLARRPQS
jgi:predicted GNAT superfamily acetyltransferase